MRNNRPAKGFCFVPGGRVQKNERLDDAFKRLSAQELGKVVERRQARLLDVYEHLYEDCVFGGDISTHYVVLGFYIKLQQSDLKLPKEEQHKRYQWFSNSEILADPKVHENTSAYLSTL